MKRSGLPMVAGSILVAGLAWVAAILHLFPGAAAAAEPRMRLLPIRPLGIDFAFHQR